MEKKKDPKDRKPEPEVDRWACQECGAPMVSYLEGADEICECTVCGFTVIRKRYT